MYEAPNITRFGSFRDLTRAGCSGPTSDGMTFYGQTGASIGNTPRITSGTIDYCFAGATSR